MGNTRTYQDIKAQENLVFSTIPGMNELLQASPAEKPEVETKYPDAVFAVVIASSLFNHNRELSEITQKAYFSIPLSPYASSMSSGDVIVMDIPTETGWQRWMRDF